MPRFAPLAALTLAVALTAPVLAQERNPSFNLLNKSETPIREFFATPAGRENWGPNRLGGKLLHPGDRIEMRRRADGNCIFDLRAVFADGRVEDHMHVDTCKLEDVVFPGAEQRPGSASVPPTATARHDPSFRLVNRGKSEITEVYATLPKAAAHGDNLLVDSTTLPPQGTRLFSLPAAAGCTYDLRVVFADKQSREKKAADLCRMGDLPVQ